jgi:hypothetical protein
MVIELPSAVPSPLDADLCVWEPPDCIVVRLLFLEGDALWMSVRSNEGWRWQKLPELDRVSLMLISITLRPVD